MEEEKKEVNIDELIQERVEKLRAIDNSIIASKKLISSGNIKVVDASEVKEDGKVVENPNPITLLISGSEMVEAMLTPTLNKLIKDRGTQSFDLDRLKAAKENQKS